MAVLPPPAPNALRRKNNPNFRGGFSLGVDLGDARTGVALGKGFSSPRPHSVLEFKGQKLEMRIVEIAEREEVDEFIIGLPRSFDGKETAQSNKVRSIAGRLAIRAAERGWPVYLQDENGTSIDALDFMINIWYWNDIFHRMEMEHNLFFPSSYTCNKNCKVVFSETKIFSLLNIDHISEPINILVA